VSLQVKFTQKSPKTPKKRLFFSDIAPATKSFHIDGAGHKDLKPNQGNFKRKTMEMGAGEIEKIPLSYL
jgi:hypothetical protein